MAAPQLIDLIVRNDSINPRPNSTRPPQTTLLGILTPSDYPLSSELLLQIEDDFIALKIPHGLRNLFAKHIGDSALLTGYFLTPEEFKVQKVRFNPDDPQLMFEFSHEADFDILTPQNLFKKTRVLRALKTDD